MAHANPEFALACRAYRDPPLRHATPGPASLADLRSRMRDIAERVEAGAATPREIEVFDLWRASVRLTRRDAAVRLELRAAVADGRAMHGKTRAGERFTEPKRRFPADVQAGRTKRDCRGGVI